MHTNGEQVAKNSGCQMDSRMTWTSTPCTTDSSTQGALARKGNGSGSSRCLVRFCILGSKKKQKAN